jgi:hypothetical protein
MPDPARPKSKSRAPAPPPTRALDASEVASLLDSAGAALDAVQVQGADGHYDSARQHDLGGGRGRQRPPSQPSAAARISSPTLKAHRAGVDFAELGPALGEAVGVVLAWSVLVHVFTLAPPALHETEHKGGIGVVAFPWLAVQPTCWTEPRLDALADAIRALDATRLVSVAGTGPDQRIVVVGGALPTARAQVDALLAVHPDACVRPESGQNPADLLLWPRWTPGDPKPWKAGITALQRRGVRVIERGRWPLPWLLLVARDFPDASLDKDSVRKVLEGVGVHDFTLETPDEDTIPADLRSERREYVFGPVRSQQRSVAQAQIGVLMALAAAVWLLGRRREDVLEGLAPVSTGVEVYRTMMAFAAGVAALALALRVPGVDPHLLRRFAPAPDSAGTLLVLVWWGALLPALHVATVFGFAGRRMASATTPAIAATLAAALTPLCTPLAFAWPLWLGLGAIAGVLWRTTGRIRGGIAVAVTVQCGFAALGLLR